MTFSLITFRIVNGCYVGNAYLILIRLGHVVYVSFHYDISDKYNMFIPIHRKLNSPIEYDFYIEQPEGYVKPRSKNKLVWK